MQQQQQQHFLKLYSDHDMYTQDSTLFELARIDTRRGSQGS